MYRYYYSKIALLLILLGCSISGITQIHFSGTIDNCLGSKFKIGRGDEPNDFKQWQKVKIKNNRFSVDLDIKEPALITCFFKSKRFHFYAIPGDSLFVTADYNKLTTTTRFTGKGKETAQFYTNWYIKYFAAHRSDKNNRNECTPEQYLEQRKKLLDSELAFLNDYAIENGLKESPFYNYYV